MTNWRKKVYKEKKTETSVQGIKGILENCYHAYVDNGIIESQWNYEKGSAIY